MKKNKDENNTTGYIEGYYGRLLSWENRKLILETLRKNKMNTYFYAPKEDIKHRLHWRKKYSTVWRKQFREFTKFSKKNNIKVIAGIAPGLDFNFKKFNNCLNENEYPDFILLYEKAQQLLEDGATSIALLLDDIPDHYTKFFGNKISEGASHSNLANKLYNKLRKIDYFVPRIYADELIEDNPSYLSDLSTSLNFNIKVFYCGPNVISENLTNYSKINEILPNTIIFWDNFYSNDYCPRRLFIGPYVKRKKLRNIMINPTGLINTDLLILDIIGNSLHQDLSIHKWLKILNNHDVPLIFNKVKQYFLKPDFGSSPIQNSLKVSASHFDALEFLLWKWKGELAREWYPYLFGLKNDIQINRNLLTSERVIKTQTQPLSEYINKNFNTGEM